MNNISNQDIMKSCFDILEKERRDLAHELHDEIGQSLTAIRASAELIARQSEGRQSHNVAQGIVSLTNGMFDLLHNMLHRLHPTVLDKLGLVDALTDLADFSKRHFNLECGIHTQGHIENLSHPLKLTIYRMVQESLTNASRHGQASQANVQISCKDKQLHITVENNGKSLSPESLHQPGIGLLGMNQRLSAFGGELNVHNIPSGGVMVHAKLPLDTLH